MDIFSNTTNFIDGLLHEQWFVAQQRAFKNALDIRTQLGKQYYLIDGYLSKVFEAFGAKPVCDFADAGERAYFTVFQKLRKEGDCGYFAKRYQENETSLRLTAITSIEKALPTLLEQFAQDYFNELSVKQDAFQIKALFDQVSALVGEEPMARLNQNLLKGFILAAPANVFLQSFMNLYFNLLTHRDMETNKQIFQLWLDDPANSQKEEDAQG